MVGMIGTGTVNQNRERIGKSYGNLEERNIEEKIADVVDVHSSYCHW
jgi:hypothetical protein